MPQIFPPMELPPLILVLDRPVSPTGHSGITSVEHAALHAEFAKSRVLHFRCVQPRSGPYLLSQASDPGVVAICVTYGQLEQEPELLLPVLQSSIVKVVLLDRDGNLIQVTRNDPALLRRADEISLV